MWPEAFSNRVTFPCQDEYLKQCVVQVREHGIDCAEMYFEYLSINYRLKPALRMTFAKAYYNARCKKAEDVDLKALLYEKVILQSQACRSVQLQTRMHVS